VFLHGVFPSGVFTHDYGSVGGASPGEGGLGRGGEEGVRGNVFGECLGRHILVAFGGVSPPGLEDGAIFFGRGGKQGHGICHTLFEMEGVGHDPRSFFRHGICRL